jgi:Right handed beta helix region
MIFNASIKVYNNKIYNGLNVFLRMEDLCIKSIEISKNDVYKNAGNAIELVGVHTFNNEIRRVLIKENLLQENVSGHGLYLERTSCNVENNEIIKGEGDSIHITGKASTMGQGPFPQIVQILNTLCRDNKGHGVNSVDFEGIIDIQDSIFNQNEGNGI